MPQHHRPARPLAICSAPAALTGPGLVAASSLEGADTAWLMSSTALVLLMALPGNALLYGGLVHRATVSNACVAVLAYSLVMTALVLWLTSRVVTLRVHEGAERAGLDVSPHNESLG